SHAGASVGRAGYSGPARIRPSVFGCAGFLDGRTEHCLDGNRDGPNGKCSCTGSDAKTTDRPGKSGVERLSKTHVRRKNGRGGSETGRTETPVGTNGEVAAGVGRSYSLPVSF